MATCPSCGASIEGDLCPKCGALAGAGQNGPGAPKKTRWVYWVVGGCLGLILIFVLLLVGGGYFVTRRLGLNSEVISKGPAHVAAQVATKLDPNLEIVSIDENTGIIRLRDKRTGKILSMNSKVPGSRPIIEDESSTNLPPAPSVKALPDRWFPIYPGKTFVKGPKRGSGIFETRDSSETVASYYENYFKELGFSVKKSFSPFPSGQESITVEAKDTGDKHRAKIKAARSTDVIKVTYEFETKE
jgi:hypothetical protein